MIRLAWSLLLIVSALSTVEAAQTHVIKRGETLTGIASRYGVSVSDLADRNDLNRNAHLYVGRRLIIPSKQNEPVRTTAGPPSAVQRAIDEARVRPKRWKYIVIHHSGTLSGSVKGMDRYHREHGRMENGLAYHFVIGNGNGMADGQIAVGRRWTKQLEGGHLASAAQNQYALGICLVGNFERQAPTDRQMRSLRQLTNALLKRCSLTVASVKTHQEINVIGTRCPGSRFKARTFRSSLELKK